MTRWLVNLGLACVFAACSNSSSTADVATPDTGVPDVPNTTDVVGDSIAVVDVADVPDVPGVPDVVDAGAVDAGGLVLRHGGLSSLGVRPAPTGGVRVVDDGFEVGSRLCAGGVCVTGGIVP